MSEEEKLKIEQECLLKYSKAKMIEKYISTLEENQQLKNNWNKIKECINKIYIQNMKETNSFPNLFNLPELNESNRILNSILEKMQELEQGSDSNEKRM